MFDIFKTNAVPIININAIALKIAKNILNISPTCSKRPTIFLSAIGSTIVEINLYDIVKTANYIIGIMQIPTITITPTNPNCIF